ncbi:hypothetical protein CAPTEDRAFT_216724 [Capitella teleta]|uniref:CARD domain-containing protein n=1 Tax=Capitella teleta TaxID=283909 RepID=R7U108_CAPTE|nr:hypothetical protein CAPTEDRAFT_216724 [Capitella teleta]|eukprot:ELT97311.1 hypothetical protein CAPTEDRAFT_216724 [Capitella teleta]
MEQKRTSKGCCGRLMDRMRCKQLPQHTACSQATSVTETDILMAGPSETDMLMAGPSETDNQPSGPSETEKQPSGPSETENQTSGPSETEKQPSGPSKQKTMILRSQGKMVLLSEQRKQILIDKRDDLAETIKMQAKLWSLMRSHNIVNKQDEDLIKLNGTPYEQVCVLLDHLAKRTDRDYEAFCECLEADDQPHVVSEILCHRVPSSSNEDVCQQLRSLYCRFEDIATGPEWAPEFALDSAKFYISLHLQKGETATT